MNKLLATLALVSTLTAGLLPVQAQETIPVEATYADIEKTFGFVPGFMKLYPKQAIGGAWEMTKGLEIEKGALDPKVKSLIGIAVAAQIPCRYCVWLDTKMAREKGATEAEIAEAVAMAGMTRNWSTVLNGMQVDFDTFKAEFGED
jgi:AhpD family alkylhydroperoxidase